MKFLLASILLTLVGWLVGCASRLPTSQTQEDLNSWDAGDSFPIMPWELPPRTQEFGDAKHGLNSLADCGYTVAGFVRPEHLPQCQKLGLRAIVGPPKSVRNWREMSDEQIDASVRQLVEESRGRGHSTVIGYFLMDEPNVRDFPALAKAAAAVKKYAPGKLAYINLYPNYATLGAPDLSQLGTSSYDEYLERFVSEVHPQLISYDNYQVQYSGDLKDPAIAGSYFVNLLAVRRVAQEHELPFWNIVSSNRIRPATPVPSPANLLLQAYTTLAAGAQGLTWYTYYGGGYAYAPVDKSGVRMPTWSYLRMVNEQVKVLGPTIRRLRSTGVYFTSPAPAESVPALPGKLVAAVNSTTPIMIGEFEDLRGDTYAMLVNLSLERSTRLTLTPAAGRTARGSISPVDGALSPLEAENSLWLTAGQGALIKFDPRNGGTTDQSAATAPVPR